MMIFLADGFKVLGDSKRLWISMATMYENVCGNCGWGRVDICMTFHKRAFDFFLYHCTLT
jgi:hypothetical protein